jgi:hypothetical protein
MTPVWGFIDRLNKQGVLGFGDGFSPGQVFWGEGVWANILRVVVVIFCAGSFGFLYGYFSKKVTATEKVLINSISACLSVFGTLLIIFAAILISRPEASKELNEMIASILYAFSHSTFFLTFLIMQLVGGFVAGFLCVDLGCKTINSPYYTLDKEKSGTFLGIKWYHYLWLYIPINAYGQIFLNLVYATGHAIITFFRSVRWFEFLGFVVSSDSGSKGNSIDVAWGKLFFIYIACAIILSLLSYLRSVLANEREMRWWKKLLLSLGIGFVLPFLLFTFTVLGG